MENHIFQNKYVILGHKEMARDYSVIRDSKSCSQKKKRINSLKWAQKS